ncbi:MAG: SDR family oxidoreductase [Anaerolineales bacterium]|nr:SDR family oxidoreductase [Anaerolineales bacterium]
MDTFKEKVVLITGAGLGTGRAIAQAFAEQGAIIAANDLSPVNLNETVQSIIAAGGQAKAYVFDIAKRMPASALVAQVVADWQRIDCLVNAAAVEPYAAFLDMDEWDWHRTIDVNLGGPYFVMQQVALIMRQQGGGAIVNLAAVIDRPQGWKGRSAYIASKAGLIGLTRQAAEELAPDHIRVNALCPGWTDREMGYPVPDPLFTTHLPYGVPPAQPQDTVELVLFLCSAAASNITGQAIPVGSAR